ncbi:pyridoxal phosphate-dependent aminotransferase [Ruegeria marina]|uniref:Histidinol-phosphate aminotransferase n=1 Tax=Ruegeria marina TaxID=639004 RepID=A0A1G6SM65_9RHOB|nr:histidinol-phosphate transaminase [Ruegeria marina]SDD18012.1 histidinol-phosphate aminotransferase [Ruegeria marina]
MRPTPYLAPMPLRGRIGRPQPKGLPVVNMGYNELPYPPLPAIRAAMEETAACAQSYGSPHCDALRDALGAAHGLDPEQIVCGNGSEELLDVIARCFARPGDEILISEFGYIQFALTANRVGATLIKAGERDYCSDVDALLAAVTDRTRLLFLANPNNPTGTMLELDELARLADDLPAQVVLVLDLAYGEFAAPGYCSAVHQLAAQFENVVVTRTFSKAYGLAGARVGWCHAPGWMVPVLYAARGMGTVNAMAQAGAVTGLADPEAIQARVDAIVSERERLSGALGQLGLVVVPSRTNFLMARFREGDPARTEALVEHLFEDAGIVVNRTRETGLEEFFRFSLSLPEHNDLLLDSVRRFIGPTS